MEKRVSFIFYRSFYDAITLLEPEERLEAMMAVLPIRPGRHGARAERRGGGGLRHRTGQSGRQSAPV